ncbi:ABC transporter permease [Methanothrix soehngenii]|uniref:ABC transporter permease n=1 Tax=Methanothrix soehngenii TaxID=2223 RepID=UPI002BDD9873|nr:FtsX-like permease family protein [Methanothrix soehngenii]HNQ51947.1 ABC transporter permease [Methanothrix soehngenii]
MPDLPSNIVSAFELTVAMRHIIYRKRGTLLSVAAIALAVSISLVSIFMMDGFRDMLFDVIIEDLPHVTVTPKEGDDYIYLYHSLSDRIWDIPGVVAVSASLGTSATFTYKENVENVAMSGVDPEDFESIYHLEEYMIKGDLISVQSGKKVILGKKLSERLKVKMGQTIYASFPDARGTSLMVSGIFDPPVGWQDDLTIVSLETARSFLNEGDVASNVDIRLEDIYQADAAARSLQDYGYKADSWQKLYPEILETLAIETFENNLIMLLILIIASFGVGSVMYLLVNEKTSEIGMLMAMGAKRQSIMNIFLIESGLLGLMGGAVGAVLGLALSLYLGNLEFSMEAPGGQKITLPVVISLESFLVIIIAAIALSIIAGSYPAYKASRLDPTQAINA